MASPLDLERAHANRPGPPKRLIVCCDGTWMDSLGTKAAPPSNVTRISRVLCRTCSDGTHQVINYFPGVGTANAIDRFTGGAFGMGLDQDIREAYNFVCANYVDGDSIILVGFSRGAFTARSVADMIASVGLLTPEGLDRFHAIFDDYENMGNPTRNARDYLLPGLPEYDRSYGQAKIEWESARMLRYKHGLREMKYTRDTYHDGVTEIKIKAIAVWDTSPFRPQLQATSANKHRTWRFTNTQISNKVENAFQALALDEPRYAFRPSLWERVPGSTTHLKQVWFPGNHGNVGGGWHDQQIADITLAWMCDQLSALGVEFSFQRMASLFLDTLRYSAAHPFPFAPQSRASSLFPVSIPNLDSVKSLLPRSVSKLVRSHNGDPRKRQHNGTRTSSNSTSGPLPWADPAVYQPPYHHPHHPRRDTSECTHRSPRASDPDPAVIPCTHPPPSVAPTHFLRAGARPWGLGMLRGPTSVVTTMAGKTVRRPGLVLRVDETTNEDTGEPLVGTNERIHSCVRVRLACGGLGLDDAGVWTCRALLGGERVERGRGAWRLERGSALLEREEWEAVGRVRGLAGREMSLKEGKYPAGVLYPVGEDDHAWRWVYTGRVEGEGLSRVPQALMLPEEPLVGYWERYLLGLMVGEVDVWKYAQRGLHGAPLPSALASTQVDENPIQRLEQLGLDNLFQVGAARASLKTAGDYENYRSQPWIPFHHVPSHPRNGVPQQDDQSDDLWKTELVETMRMVERWVMNVDETGDDSDLLAAGVSLGDDAASGAE
ncbi:hypothetical protein MFIFM68171_11251 [Madurella fahalii]|uniref:T6SS Phospholipase effector Tle1-like catalytic domain-containing protein n=1 Tax=Madurella fahalii TaxID=1157608 RepID=A0ABQ0GTH1_9PEZI